MKNHTEALEPALDIRDGSAVTFKDRYFGKLAPYLGQSTLLRVGVAVMVLLNVTALTFSIIKVCSGMP
ncbi:hypothetical protein IV500_05140 [Paeniglutamicibacter antarcticus]|uniref:Uncharacterized protein n=1 Tax=Arthrobacter terrae TaxID=2935737 RepID=A0A931CPV5_9MICC|nr:hypothetical protein [Arthrobacter terrae]MBG0738804.1 hypothetical protein [Arthrobacter terrae]